MKKCRLCNEVIVASEVKHARLIPNGIRLCKDCKTCKQCFRFFIPEDLDNRHKLRRQGCYWWHGKCFKCVVSIHIHKHYMMGHLVCMYTSTYNVGGLIVG